VFVASGDGEGADVILLMLVRTVFASDFIVRYRLTAAVTVVAGASAARGFGCLGIEGDPAQAHVDPTANDMVVQRKGVNSSHMAHWREAWACMGCSLICRTPPLP
jgi:hypothetical protein